MTPLEQARARGPVDPRVTVIIPVYNGEAYLAAALASVAAQTVVPATVIVVDDGSTDGSAGVARSFGATVHAQPNGGLSAARNAGIRVAASEYVAFLDADDVWLPRKLERQLAALDAFRLPAFAFTDFRLLDERGIDPRYGMFNHPAFVQVTGGRARGAYVPIAAGAARPVLTDNYILPSSAIVRRDDALTIGLFNESIRVSEDTEFFLRLFARVPGLALPELLTLYRRHDAQISAKKVALIGAFFTIRDTVLAAPERYPAADVAYLRGASWLIHRRIGVMEARAGRFEAARQAFGDSWRARPSAGAAAGLALSVAGTSVAGRSAFVALRLGVRGLRRISRATGGRA